MFLDSIVSFISYMVLYTLLLQFASLFYKHWKNFTYFIASVSDYEHYTFDKLYEPPMIQTRVYIGNFFMYSLIVASFGLVYVYDTPLQGASLEEIQHLGYEIVGLLCGGYMCMYIIFRQKYPKAIFCLLFKNCIIISLCFMYLFYVISQQGSIEYDNFLLESIISKRRGVKMLYICAFVSLDLLFLRKYIFLTVKETIPLTKEQYLKKLTCENLATADYCIRVGGNLPQVLERKRTTMDEELISYVGSLNKQLRYSLDSINTLESSFISKELLAEIEQLYLHINTVIQKNSI